MALTKNDKLIWLAIANECKIKNPLIFSHLTNPSNILQMSTNDFILYKKKFGKYFQQFSNILDRINKFDLQKYEFYLNILERNNIEIIPISDSSYPPQLKYVDNPPLVLFYKGDMRNFKNCVAIVGRRECSHYANFMSREISRCLATNSTIVSGLARGIDIEAHLGALDIDGSTIAVLGKPIQKIYPPEFIEISKEILEKGLLISESFITEKSSQTEFTMGRVDFILRNRIISGISKAVIIIETNRDGGTMHQLDFSLKQKRPTFILKPKNEKGENYNGYKIALEKGAQSFTQLDEINEKISKIMKQNDIHFQKPVINQDITNFL